MAGLSAYLQQKLLEHVFDNTAYVQPTTVYLSLHTGDPLDDNTGNTEVTAGTDAAYARQSISFAFSSPDSIASDALITFPAVDGGSPGYTVTHFGIYDAVSGGNLLWSGVLGSAAAPASQALVATNTVSFGVGALALTMD